MTLYLHHLVRFCLLYLLSIPGLGRVYGAERKWTQEAMVKERRASGMNDTWISFFHNTVGCKWVFSVKQIADGSMQTIKQGWLRRVYAKTYGIDYPKTIAPAAKVAFDSCVTLFCAANLGWNVQQLDVIMLFYTDI